MSESDTVEEELLPCMEKAYQRAFYLTKNVDKASDLVQDAYLKAARKIDQYRSSNKPCAWLNRVLYGIFVDGYRSKQRQPTEVALDEIQAEYDSICDPLDALPGEEVARQMDAWGEPEIAAALDKLPENYREVSILVDAEGYSYEEAAEMLGIPVGTVRSRLYRSRKLLYNFLYDYARKNRHLQKTIQTEP